MNSSSKSSYSFSTLLLGLLSVEFFSPSPRSPASPRKSLLRRETRRGRQALGRKETCLNNYTTDVNTWKISTRFVIELGRSFRLLWFYVEFNYAATRGKTLGKFQMSRKLSERRKNSVPTLDNSCLKRRKKSCKFNRFASLFLHFIVTSLWPHVHRIGRLVGLLVGLS